MRSHVQIVLYVLNDYPYTRAAILTIVTALFLFQSLRQICLRPRVLFQNKITRDNLVRTNITLN